MMEKTCTSVGIVLVMILCGCTSTGRGPTNRALKSLSTYQQELERNKEQIATVMQSIDDVVAADASTRERDFRRFVKAVSRTQSRSGKMDRRARRMQARGDTLFANWQQKFGDIEDSEIRERSAERRQQGVERHKQITEATQAAADGYDPFLRDLHDIRNALQNDLTPGGIATVSNVVERARVNAQKLQGKLDVVVELVRREQQELSG